jgi:hypothetical protein
MICLPRDFVWLSSGGEVKKDATCHHVTVLGGAQGELLLLPLLRLATPSHLRHEHLMGLHTLFCYLTGLPVRFQIEIQATAVPTTEQAAMMVCNHGDYEDNKHPWGVKKHYRHPQGGGMPPLATATTLRAITAAAVKMYGIVTTGICK